MKSNKSKTNKILKTIMIILLVIISLVALKIFIFRRNAFTDIKIENYAVANPITISSPKKIVEFERDDSLKKSSPVKLILSGKRILSSETVYSLNQRYYVKIQSFLNELNIPFTNDNRVYGFNNCMIDMNKNIYTLNHNTYSLRGLSYVKDDSDYISINDLLDILDLRSHWDIENESIYMFKDKSPEKESTISLPGGKPALIRIEDFSAGSGQESNNTFEKFRIIGDYLNTNNIKYSITWIPRYKNPPKNIDNDLLKNDTMSNAEFIYTLDYLINKGASIGLHGYTHQYGDTVSSVGSELTWKYNTKESEVRDVAENAIRTAEVLNIPYDFFETPHYHATTSQQKILSEYFKVIYEPCSGYWNANPIFKDDTLYVPAALGYVKDSDGLALAEKIRKKSDFTLTSIFVHPFKETAFIELGEVDKNGYVDYKYKDGSPIKNIVSALCESEYTTIHAAELVK